MLGKIKCGTTWQPHCQALGNPSSGHWTGDRGDQPITRAGLEEAFPDKIKLLGQVEENLYTGLSSFTDGEAWSIASNTPEGHGLEVCFRSTRQPRAEGATSYLPS